MLCRVTLMVSQLLFRTFLSTSRLSLCLLLMLSLSARKMLMHPRTLTYVCLWSISLIVMMICIMTLILGVFYLLLLCAILILLIRFRSLSQRPILRYRLA
jgi:hypothetical protein